MSGRLTDKRIDQLMIMSGNLGLNRESAAEIRAMALELRMRRHADLTAEEREALVFLRQWLGNNGLVYYKNYDGKKTEYDAVLVKLLSTTHNGGGDDS